MPTDWSQYEVLEESPENQEIAVSEDTSIEQPNTENKDPTNWEQYADVEEMSGVEKAAFEVGRTANRMAARIGETLIGYPGDIVNFAKFLEKKIPKAPKGFEKNPNLIQSKLKDFAESLPTRSELRENTKKLSEGFTEPQNALEEFGDSITELATLLSVGKGAGVWNLMKSTAHAIAATSTTKISELLGAGPGMQSFVEFLTLITTGAAEKPLANAFVADKYAKARSSIPSGIVMDTTKAADKLTNLESELSRGITTATKTEVKDAASQLRSKASAGVMEVDEVVQSFHDVNERKTSKKLYDELDRPGRKLLKYRYDQLSKILRTEIEKYGKTNPEFLSHWNEANEAFSALRTGAVISNFVEKNTKKLPQRVRDGMAIELVLGHPKAAVATGATYGTIKTGEMLYQISKSPALRSHYKKVFSAAASENTPLFISEMGKLEEELQKKYFGKEKSKEKNKK